MANPEHLSWLFSLQKYLFLLLTLEREGLIPVTNFVLVPFLLLRIGAIMAYLWHNRETSKVAFVMDHLPPTELI